MRTSDPSTLTRARLAGLPTGVIAAALAHATPAYAQASGPAIPLDRLDDHIRVELPERSRESIDAPVPITSAWKLVATAGGTRTWEVPIPVRLRTLYHSKPPKGLSLVKRRLSNAGWAGGRAVKHANGLGRAERAHTWDFTSHALRVRRPIDLGPPEPGEYAVRYARGVERENELQLAESGLAPLDFVKRSLQVDDATRHGLLLPAPAGAYIDLIVPDGGVLDLAPLLLPPEAADPALQSDGATLRVRIREGERVTTLGSVEVTDRTPRPVRFDLDPWSGERISLELITAPGDNAALDYVFVADPVVYVPEADPPRVVLVFIDTLRADHMSVYGYDRDTTPNLDEWAEGAAVFEQARSVAPWTLPSARTMMTGHQPELWGQVDTLQARFARAGWANAFLAGNIYLSSNFEGADDWGLHRCINWPSAEVQVQRATEFLDAHPERPAFLLLHFMDVHLPYLEPLSWRGAFAGERPDVFDSDVFHRNQIVRHADRLGESGKAYVVGRYDNNIGYVDDELSAVLDRLSADDTVVVVSDHGEEFWEHGGFEHGHTLYDEVLRVPLIARGPGLEPGRVQAPVSLLDVAPTLARSAGLEHEDMAGWPLQEAANGERAADFAARPQAFGRPLYGDRRWGVLIGDDKYTTHQGADELYDLSEDPGEQDDLLSAAWTTPPLPHWLAMAGALQRPVCSGLRLNPGKSRSDKALEVELMVPGGVAWAYAGDDPTLTSAADVRIEGERVVARFPGGYRGTREVFVVPMEDPAEVVRQSPLLVRVAGQETTIAVPDARAVDGRGGNLSRTTLGGRSVELAYAIVPSPPPEGGRITGYDAEAAQELAALGYVDLDAGQPEELGGGGGGTLAADVTVPERCRTADER